MRRNTLLIDVGIALVLAILVVVISPGLAVVGLLALLVLLICAVSFGIDRFRRRSRGNPVRELRRSQAADSRSASARRPGSASPSSRRAPPSARGPRARGR